jgi:hypothetical protein
VPPEEFVYIDEEEVDRKTTMGNLRRPTGVQDDTANVKKWPPLPLFAKGAAVEVLRRRTGNEPKPTFEQLPMGPHITYNAPPKTGT